MKLENGLLAIVATLLAGMGLDLSGISAWLADLADISLWAFQWAYRLGLLGLAGGLVVGLARLHAGYSELQADKAHNKRLRELDIEERQADIAIKRAMAVSSGRAIQVLKPSQRAIIAGHTGELSLIEAAATPQLPPIQFDDRGDGQGGDQNYLDIGEFISGLAHATTYNLRMTGDTQRGKTTLVLNLLAEIIKPLREAEIYVVDPKYLPHKHKAKWGNLSVACNSIKTVQATLEHIHENAFLPRLEADYPLAFVILDEVDWLYSEFGGDYLEYINQWAKVGSEAGFFVWLIGQSALVKTSGIDTALQQNFNHVALGKSAYQAVKQAESIHDKTERDTLLLELRAHQQATKYFGVYSQQGDWQAFRTPHLTKPEIVTTVDVEALPQLETAMGGLEFYEAQFDLSAWLNANPVEAVGRSTRPDRILFLASQGVNQLADIVTACYKSDGSNQRNYVTKILTGAGYTVTDDNTILQTPNGG